MIAHVEFGRVMNGHYSALRICLQVRVPRRLLNAYLHWRFMRGHRKRMSWLRDNHRRYGGVLVPRPVGEEEFRRRWERLVGGKDG